MWRNRWQVPGLFDLRGRRIAVHHVPLMSPSFRSAWRRWRGTRRARPAHHQLRAGLGEVLPRARPGLARQEGTRGLLLPCPGGRTPSRGPSPRHRAQARRAPSPNPRRIERLQDRPVAETDRIGDVGLTDHRFRLLDRQRVARRQPCPAGSSISAAGLERVRCWVSHRKKPPLGARRHPLATGTRAVDRSAAAGGRGGAGTSRGSAGSSPAARPRPRSSQPDRKGYRLAAPALAVGLSRRSSRAPARPGARCKQPLPDASGLPGGRIASSGSARGSLPARHQAPRPPWLWRPRAWSRQTPVRAGPGSNSLSSREPRRDVDAGSRPERTRHPPTGPRPGPDRPASQPRPLPVVALRSRPGGQAVSIRPIKNRPPRRPSPRKHSS